MSLSPFSYKVERFGHEQEPIIVIENYTSNMAYLKQRAHHAAYKRSSSYYPGLQAPEDPNYLGIRGDELISLMSTVFNFKGKLNIESCDYSMVCKPRDTLDVAQCLPHYDALTSNLFAIVHYVQAEPTSGTAFYRHKRTGFETISEKRSSAYKEGLQDDLSTYGPPDKNYFYGTDDRYEMIGEIEAKPDQLIMYRGHTLHSGCIPDSTILAPDPKVARITLNSFLKEI